ncbi:MAG: bifunctional DNA-binding transcriptional regulator/O6-methylguanine-DNA methyltransferase Ada [Pyrinomonadaceae bacterium]|nr:bifunctional DNA-binding transcriptional regulator/O6-methylguanine-DNA methyltransferase Ada [Pyrinomonadaceae bacterium]
MNNEIFWQAMTSKDARFNGIFFVEVKTTKIYCKPTCTARLPKRENVEFVRTWQEAEKNGFRACLRCQPRLEKTINPQVESVLRVCELLESEENISLENLSAELNLSPYHLQRTFKEIIGVSPKKYAENLRLEKFKSEIKQGSDVVTAMYESGYGSSSRLYENITDKLGMTPKTYQKGGKGMKIDYTITDCDLGKMLVARTEKGVCAVTFGDEEKFLTDRLLEEYPNAEINQDATNLKEYVEAILQNLSGSNKRIVLPIDVQATAFQMQVWEALRKIPYGETLSYKQVAESLGNPKAVRAVARACATNRVAIVIPCHRVVGSDGKLSGYRWGIERKKKLLDAEKGRRGDAAKA